MTTPYFMPPPGPDLRPTQAPPAPSSGDYLQQGVAGIIKAITQARELEQQQQQLEMQKKEYSSVQAKRGVDTQAAQFELQQKQKGLKAAEGGLSAYQQWVGSGGDFNQFGPIVAKISDPMVAQDFANRVKDHLGTINTGAQAQANTADANVATATQGNRIQNAQTQADLGVLQIAELQRKSTQEQQDRAGIEKAIGRLPPNMQGPTRSLMEFSRAGVDLPKEILPLMFPALAGLKDVDPQKINAFTSVFKTGQFSAGQAATMLRIPLPPGVDPNARMPLPQNTANTQNKVMSDAATAADKVINDLTNKGTRIKIGDALIQGTKAGNVLIPPDQQQLIQSGNMFAQGWQYFVTGKSATEQELRRIIGTIVPVYGDADPTIAQKAIMRQVILQALQSGQTNARPASAILNEAISNARALGIKPDGVGFLQQEAAKAKMEERSGRPRAVIPGLDSTTQAYSDSLGAFDFGDSTP